MAGKLRWAVHTSSWVPSEQVRSLYFVLQYLSQHLAFLQEWLQVLSHLQAEEVDRVSKFVYQRDSKFAAVGSSEIALACGLCIWFRWDGC